MRKRDASSGKAQDTKATQTDGISYGQAIEQLEAIIERIDEGEIGVDELAEAVKQAVGLVRTCRQRLRSTQEEVELALQEMDTEPERANTDGEETGSSRPGNGRPALTLSQATQQSLVEIDVFSEE